MGENFYRYNFERNNCQQFIKALLSNSGLLTQEASKFIEQDAVALLEKTPGRVKEAVNLITDFASVADRFKQILGFEMGGVVV
jgi:hypothetical protein